MNPRRKVSMTKNMTRRAVPGLLFAALVLCASPIQAQDPLPPPDPHPDLSEKLDRNLDAIEKAPNEVITLIEATIFHPDPPTSRPNPVYSTWVGVHTFESLASPEGGAFGRPTFTGRGDGTEIRILNPGMQMANVSCTFISDGGVLLDAIRGSQTIDPGHKGFCKMLVPLGRENVQGWVIVSADRPILVDGYQRRTISRNTSASLTFHPIDCLDPTGLEFVCLVGRPQ